jgi:hypothetical protein
VPTAGISIERVVCRSSFSADRSARAIFADAIAAT